MDLRPKILVIVARGGVRAVDRRSQFRRAAARASDPAGRGVRFARGAGGAVYDSSDNNSPGVSARFVGTASVLLIASWSNTFLLTFSPEGTDDRERDARIRLRRPN